LADRFNTPSFFEFVAEGFMASRESVKKLNGIAFPQCLRNVGALLTLRQYD
jgi:hypothetical protein